MLIQRRWRWERRRLSAFIFFVLHVFVCKCRVYMKAHLAALLECSSVLYSTIWYYVACDDTPCTRAHSRLVGDAACSATPFAFLNPNKPRPRPATRPFFEVPSSKFEASRNSICRCLNYL